LIVFILHTGITVAFQIFVGDLQLVKTEHAILFSKGVTVIPKLSFADLIINPGKYKPTTRLSIVIYSCSTLILILKVSSFFGFRNMNIKVF